MVSCDSPYCDNCNPPPDPAYTRERLLYLWDEVYSAQELWDNYGFDTDYYW